MSTTPRRPLVESTGCPEIPQRSFVYNDQRCGRDSATFIHDIILGFDLFGFEAVGMVAGFRVPVASVPGGLDLF